MPKDECAEAHKESVDVSVACRAHVERCTGNDGVEHVVNWCLHGYLSLRFGT